MDLISTLDSTKNWLILWSLVTFPHNLMLVKHVINYIFFYLFSPPSPPPAPIFLEKVMLRFISMNVPVAWDLFELFYIAAIQSAFL